VKGGPVPPATPTREPVDATLNGEPCPFQQQRDRVVSVAVTDSRHREINQQPEAGCGALVKASARSSIAVAAGSPRIRNVLPAHPGNRLSSQMTKRPAGSLGVWLGREASARLSVALAVRLSPSNPYSSAMRTASQPCSGVGPVPAFRCAAWSRLRASGEFGSSPGRGMSGEECSELVAVSSRANRTSSPASRACRRPRASWACAVTRSPLPRTATHPTRAAVSAVTRAGQAEGWETRRRCAEHERIWSLRDAVLGIAARLRRPASRHDPQRIRRPGGPALVTCCLPWCRRRGIRRCAKRAVARQLFKLLERYDRPAVELLHAA
jgi:hypothetical protein